ncbi:unnamed protein product [Rotaria magnacalcarata]|uniref:CARD domain-containing protein n=1 Tax=Rotaria magnacalcarata TaxID=392030 RepID=A0A817AME1_9BILA|nr:unnamed protein product [Rotaria magnacalcarata]CAF3830742.1 unnamed protein product [Rotaria magnacalcarata]
MDRDSANATRLRVNRIALTQQLNVQELTPKLVRARILSVNNDIPYINEGTTSIDRARRLVNCLLTPTSIGKDVERGQRPANWFLIFRSILLENSSSYGELVTALDNTVIRTPDFAQRASDAFADKTNAPRSHEFRESVNKELLRASKPKQNDEQKLKTPIKSNQEQITKIEFDPYAMNKISIEGSFQKVVDNLTYLSQIPEHLFDQLSRSKQTYDCEQLDAEHQTFDDMRRLELMNNLMQQESALANQSVFDTEIVDTILSNSKNHHYFYKYFIALSSIYGIHFDRQFLQSFSSSLDKQDNFIKIIDKGFQLYHFLYGYGRYELCRQAIERIVQALTKTVKQQQPTIWNYLFRACCALIQIHNQSVEIKDAWARIEAANEIADNLKTTGIEIPSNDYAWLYFSVSQTAYEDANFDACIQYCYRGLKAADKNNHSLIVDLLCSLAQGLTSKWIMNKAQATAVMAVQYATKYCGRNDPKFVYALQQLVQFSNEFIQDTSTIELSKYTFDRARTIYGYESIVVAHSHRALSKSLITLASTTFSRRITQESPSDNKSTDFSQAPFLHHANEAYRIAQDCFGVEDRIRLFPFKMSLAHALQSRASSDQTVSKDSYFNDAMELLDDCLTIANDTFGTMSFKVAQVHRLRSATYLSKKMYNEAEQQLNTCLQIYKLCLPPNSFHYLVTKASLGLIYKQQGNYIQALAIFQSISSLLDTKAQSFRWINMVLESLIECYTHMKGSGHSEEDPATSSIAHNAAEKVRAELYEWRRTNVKPADLMNLIQQEPARTLHQFLHDSTKFQETTDRVHALMHTQLKAKNRMSLPLPTTDTKTHQEA